VSTAPDEVRGGPPPTDGGKGGDGGTPPTGFTIDPDTAKFLESILGPPGSGGGTKRIDPTVATASRDYFQIWGVDPPHGYIEGLVRSGMNRFEIISLELSKPQARRTAFYRDTYARLAATAAQLFGFR